MRIIGSGRMEKDCSKPITKINISKLNTEYNKLKNLNAEDLKLSQKTIPNYILFVTAVGIICEFLAYFMKIPWYAPGLIFGCVIGFLVMKFQDMKAEECY